MPWYVYHTNHSTTTYSMKLTAHTHQCRNKFVHTGPRWKFKPRINFPFTKVYEHESNIKIHQIFVCQTLPGGSDIVTTKRMKIMTRKTRQLRSKTRNILLESFWFFIAKMRRLLQTFTFAKKILKLITTKQNFETRRGCILASRSAIHCYRVWSIDEKRKLVRVSVYLHEIESWLFRFC